MTYSRIHRLLKIITLIQSGADWNPERLAKECQCTARTVHRCLKDLETIGVPLSFDRQSGGYRIDRDFFLPPVHLTVDEALAIAVLCEQVAEQEQIPYLRPAWRAMTKLQAQLPTDIRAEMDELSRVIAVKTAQRAPADGASDVFDLLQLAIANHKSVQCRYESMASGNDSDWFRFDPFMLLFSVRAWYVIGHHHGRNEVRCLKLTRFTGTELSDTAFTPPKNFTIDDYLGNAWRMIRSDQEHQVEIWFDAEFAGTIGETMWHKTQEIDEHEDGSATFKCTVDGLDEIVWWVLSMGPHCKVGAPEALGTRVCELASQTAALYA